MIRREQEKALAEVGRLQALLAAGPWDAWRNAEAEVVRLRAALEGLILHDEAADEREGLENCLELTEASDLLRELRR